ncbi:hypothetical protein [Caviibacter abscessus]|uniref:hypothetical protein n=1 Tax=Caviibacter abscessus TaxID=1766719 RepID=UPI000837B4C2|nr:hypothetical protein [Caviibacter abscessus]
MKKTLIFLLLISALSYSKDYRIKFKSDLETTIQNGQYVGIMYRPVDLKVYTLNNKVNFFVKIRGQRDDITKRDEVYRHDKLIPNPIISPEEIKKEYTEKLKGNDSESNFDILGGLNKDHYHSPHEHDSQDSDHDHDCVNDEEHEHEHDPNILNLENYVTTKPVREDNDMQVKLGVGYNPTKYIKAKFTYFPLSYNGDERRYHKSILVDYEHNILLKDNLSLTFRPKFSTFDLYKPQLAELRTDIRYKYDENTVISGSMYNALQFKAITEKHNFKNSLQFTYDYNKEKRRYHEFWEILDHEHEKLEQLKFDLRVSHNGSYLLNPLKDAKLRYDQLDNSYESQFKLIYKKPNVGLKGSEFTNELRINSYIDTTQTSGRKYNVKSALYSENGQKMDVDKNNLSSIIDFSKPNKSSLRHQNEDKSKYEDYYYYTGKDGKKYLVIESGTSTNPTQYQNVEIVRNELSLENKTKYKYKEYEFNNKFELQKDLNGERTVIYNESKFSYDKKLAYGLRAKPFVGHLYAPLFDSQGLGLHYNIIKFGVDVSEYFSYDGLKLKVGLEAQSKIQLRKAKPRYVQDENMAEANKWVMGAEIDLKPYVKAEYTFQNNLKLFGKVEIPVIFGKNALSVGSGNKFNKAEDDFTFKYFVAMLKAGIKYEW